MSEKAAVQSAEAIRHAAQAETLAAQASAINVQSIAMKATVVALNGPVQALVGKMSNAVFFRTQLLLQSKKATPKSLQKSISKAMSDNVEQKRIAKEIGDTKRMSELEAQEKILIDAQKNLDSSSI